MLQDGNGRLVLQALPKTMTIKLDKKSEALLREMLRKNSRYGSVHAIVNEAVAYFMCRRRRKDFVSASGSNVLLEHYSLRMRNCILVDALQVLSLKCLR